MVIVRVLAMSNPFDEQFAPFVALAAQSDATLVDCFGRPWVTRDNEPGGSGYGTNI
jgi:hypothetical protein